MTRGIGGPNRPPEKPAKFMSDAQKTGSSAKPEAEAAPKALPVPGKGKQPVELTQAEQEKLAKKQEKADMKAAIAASIDSENKRIGAGTSGVADEKPTPPPTPKALSRSNSDLGSLRSDRPMRDANHLAGEPSSEPSTLGSSRLTRSMSEASSLNSQDIREFHEAMRKAGGRPVYDPLDTDVNVPEYGSGPSTPATKPHAGQDGRVTFPDSPSSNSLTSVDLELPDTQHAQPRPPEKKRPLGKFTIPQRIGMAVAGGIALAGIIVAKVVGSDGDSSNDVNKI